MQTRSGVEITVNSCSRWGCVHLATGEHVNRHTSRRDNQRREFDQYDRDMAQDPGTPGPGALPHG